MIRGFLIGFVSALAAFVALPSTAAQSDPVFVGAGDIASCFSTGDEDTAGLLDAIDGTVYTLGDNVYETGTATEFTDCYAPTWGRHKARTMPSPGNHDYNISGATAYYSYFGAAAGDPAKGYYSYDLGAWHIIAINSNCAAIGGCDAGSAQEQWLRTDLVSNPSTCTVAYWHHPRFSSGPHGNTLDMQPIWQALYDLGADVVLSGHDHSYERFAPQTPTGVADPAHGIREFVVGSGGRSHYPVGTPVANSETHNDDTYGVLKLMLHEASYNWEFIPVSGGAYADSGSASCVSLAVGGAAAAPEIATKALRMGDSSDSRPHIFAGLSVALASVFLGAAAWYTKRRYLR